MSQQETLFSYTIPFDDGAAPNPYWGILTLAICKPVIRRVANIGDWIVATGSKNSPIGDIQHSIVYLMKITNKLSLEDYDNFCKKELPQKIPDIKNSDLRRQVGDCIYDFSNNSSGELRPSVHESGNKKTDLGGKSVLLSKHFYYFGNKPIDLPSKFQRIVKPNQGHRSSSNDDIAEEFLTWVKNLKLPFNTLVGKPQTIIDFRKNKEIVKTCANEKCKIDIEDEIEHKAWNIC